LQYTGFSGCQIEIEYNQRMTSVSVLLPCFNAQDTLESTLQSLASQTCTDFEIVAVNDGSTDGSGEILENWAKRDARFRVMHIEHSGIVMALNVGLERCRGRYVARMDADDLAHPERLTLQSVYLDMHPEIALVSSLVAGFPAADVREGFRVYLEWLNGLVHDDDIRRELFVESPLPHPSVMFRREVVRSLGGYQERGWAEDYDLWLRMALAGAHFGKIEQVLLDWREHPGRLTRVDSRYSLENFLRCKAHYLMQGPLSGRDAVIVWGAGMMGRRLSKQLAQRGAPLAAYVDVDPKKIGRTQRGLPIISVEDLPACWATYSNPIVLTAVGARGSRPLIRQALRDIGLQEGRDWWSAA
jgi:glycosyltransferase involved in cell wall biosynthesis